MRKFAELKGEVTAIRDYVDANLGAGDIARQQVNDNTRDEVPLDLTLERVNRLTQAVADLGENQLAQGRMLLQLLNQMSDQLDAFRTELAAVTGTVRDLASEQVLLGNRVESAATSVLRANIRLDEIEDEKGAS
jgi:hypothetical protein